MILHYADLRHSFTSSGKSSIAARDWHVNKTSPACWARLMRRCSTAPICQELHLTFKSLPGQKIKQFSAWCFIENSSKAATTNPALQGLSVRVGAAMAGVMCCGYHCVRAVLFYCSHRCQRLTTGFLLKTGTYLLLTVRNIRYFNYCTTLCDVVLDYFNAMTPIISSERYKKCSFL